MAAERRIEAHGTAMGTSFVVVVHRDDAGLLAAAVEHIDELERRWSRFLPESEISILNRTPGRPVIVSADTFLVIQAAVDAAQATEGRFDPTVHDTMSNLGYDRTFAELPDPDAMGTPSAPAPSVAAPGVSGIVFDDSINAVALPDGVRLDLGGIGKGTAADLVSERLIERGANGAAVSIGGDLRVQGESPERNGWTVSYKGTPLAIAPLDDGGVCTSTVSRRRWETTAGVVHHIVDPRTGRPTDGTVESVTVVAGSAQQAEVLTKLAMVAGPHAECLLAARGVTAFVRRREPT